MGCCSRLGLLIKAVLLPLEGKKWPAALLVALTAPQAVWAVGCGGLAHDPLAGAGVPHKGGHHQEARGHHHLRPAAAEFRSMPPTVCCV